MDAARRELSLARDTAELQKGYMGFELADANLRECVAAIEKLTDRDQIVSMLSRAYDTLPLTTGGAARPVVEHVRDTLVDLRADLEQPA